MEQIWKVAVYSATTHPLIKHFPKQIPKWGNCEFILNSGSEDCDCLFVIDSILGDIPVKCGKENTFLCICEPASVKLYSSKYINQFGNIVSFRNFSRYKGNTISSFPLLPWMVGSKFDFDLKAWDKDNFLDYDTLQQRVTCDKKNKVAVITSNKTLTRGHRQRLDFILKLKSIIPDLLDIYGEGFDFVIDKYNIYSKYKYVLAFENCREKGYWTEKIADAYLCEAFPFYWGAPDLSNYFSEAAYEEIDMSSVDFAAQKMKQYIKSNYYKNKLPMILEEKKKILNNYNPFIRISQILENRIVESKSADYCLFQEKKTWIHKIRQLYYRTIK